MAVTNMRCDAGRQAMPVGSCAETACWAWIDAPFARNCMYMAAEITDGFTLDQIGAMINLTRERVRQIEAIGRGKMLSVINTRYPGQFN